jgi:hypothetical protein
MFYYSRCKVDLHLQFTMKISLSFKCTFLYLSISIFPQLSSSPHSLLFPLPPHLLLPPRLHLFLPSPSSLPSLPMSLFGAALYCNVFFHCCTVLRCPINHHYLALSCTVLQCYHCSVLSCAAWVVCSCIVLHCN